MRIGAAQARARVEAHLGRPPQDALEAAVVLEAWGGMRASSALELGAAVVENGAAVVENGAAASPGGAVSAPRGMPPAPPARSRGQGLALAAALLATVTWTTPLMRTFGVATFQRGWHVALPVSLGVQWLLQRRSLGVLALPRRRRAAACLLGAAALAVGTSSALAPGAVLVVALALTWLSVLVVVQRGWGFPYAAIIAAGGVVMRLGLSGAAADLALMLVLSLTGLGAAAGTTPAPTRRPAPWRLAVAAGLAGATVGLLIALGARGPFAVNSDLAVLALMPALVGTLWSARHLTRLWELSGKPLLGGLHSGPLPRRAPLARRILAGALVRLTAGSGFLSLLVLALGALRHENVQALAWLLATASGMGLIGLLVALLEAFGRQGWALLTAAATAAPLLLRWRGIAFGTHGETVLASVLICLLISMWTVRYFLEDPHRSLVVATL